MRKILIGLTLASLAGCMGGIFSSCGGCFGLHPMREHWTQEKAKELNPEEYRLTDSDVRKLIRDLPEVAEDLRKLGLAIDAAPTTLGKGLAQFTRSKALLAKLRAKGWDPPEKFFLALSKALVALQYLKMKELYEAQAKEMEKLLKDPRLPEAQKELLRQQIEEMEKPRGMEGESLEDDIRVVKRHQEELMKAFEEAFGK